MKIIFFNPRQRRLTIFLIVLLLLTTANFAYTATNFSKPGIVITEDYQLINLKEYSNVYSTEFNYSLEEAEELINEDKLRKKAPAFKDYVWITFQIENKLDTNVNLLLEIDNSLLDYYELYLKIDDSLGFNLVASGGDIFPFKNRNIENRRFLEGFNIKANSSVACLLYIDDRDRNTSIALSLWERKSFYIREAKENLFYNLYFGGLLFIGIFSIIIGFIFKMRVFYAYGGYALVMASYMFVYLGFAFQVFYPERLVLKRFLDDFIDMPLYLSFMIFAASFFKVKPKNRMCYRLVLSHIILMISAILFWFISKARFPIHYYLIGSYILLAYTLFIVIVLVIKGYKKNKQRSSFFIAAGIAIFGTGFLFAFSDAGILPMELFPANPLLIGSILEFGIFSVALLYEVRNINRAKNKLLQEHADYQKKLLSAYVEGNPA